MRSYPFGFPSSNYAGDVSGEPINLDDLGRMRAVMHPVRWQVLKELYSGTVLTATQAGDLTGLTASAMSYHLQQLAKMGLIERGDSSDGRERPWKAAGTGLMMSAQPDAAVGVAMMRNLLADVARLLATPPPGAGESRPWPMSYAHANLRLTRDDAKDLFARIDEVVRDFEANRQNTEAPNHDVYWIQGVGDPVGPARE